MKVLGIFRGFPGLGRVVSGVSLLEELRDNHGCEIKIISYLQGNKYLTMKGYNGLHEVISADYCSIGLLPTNKMGVYIHNTINEFNPDVIVIDGEPLILQSIKISHPDIKIVALLNPADIENPSNDREAMEYFNSLYSLADLAIVHGLKAPQKFPVEYTDIIFIPTILRHEILNLTNQPTSNIYCILGGGTVNAAYQFIESSVRIACHLTNIAKNLEGLTFHLICSSENIYNAVIENDIPQNVRLYKGILPASEYYVNAGAVVTRSGRNTLSELAYLGIPAITFVTGDKYRVMEQQQNIQSLIHSNIVPVSLDSSDESILEALRCLIFHKMQFSGEFLPGNNIAISKILSLK